MGVALKREMRNKSDARFRARDPSFILPFHRVAHGRARKCLIARRLGVPGSHPKGGEATLSPGRVCERSSHTRLETQKFKNLEVCMALLRGSKRLVFQF